MVLEKTLESPLDFKEIPVHPKGDQSWVFIGWRRKWQPTPVFVSRESPGQRSLVGCCLWGCTESDMTEAT